jgi:hypothetical protein
MFAEIKRRYIFASPLKQGAFSKIIEDEKLKLVR